MTGGDKPEDIFKLLAPVVAARLGSNPWTGDEQNRVFRSDHELLEKMLAIPIGEGAGSQSGRLAKSIDGWVTAELLRAGFTDDEVWPRIDPPRVLPRDIAQFIDKLPDKIKDAAWRSLLRNKSVAPSDAKVLGRAYVKQIDVLIAHWSRGVELLVSTKSMVSSFNNNLTNRFEESYGDAKNLRGRFPLASMGFLFLLRSTALKYPSVVERITDMMRKLRAENDVYDTTCLLVVDWTDDGRGVKVLQDAVPDDLSADNFLGSLVRGVMTRTPVDMHVAVREKFQARKIPLDSSDVRDEESDPEG